MQAGGNELRAEAARGIVGAGVAVMGHTGLMPQSVSVLGGFSPQGRTAESALIIIQDAIVRTWLQTDPSRRSNDQCTPYHEFQSILIGIRVFERLIDLSKEALQALLTLPCLPFKVSRLENWALIAHFNFW